MLHQHAENYNVRIWDDQGHEHLMHANQLRDLDLHHWQGWQCHAGFDYIYVHEDGETWGGMCQNTHLGNIHHQAKLLPSPDTCRQTTCTGCTTDLTVEKYRP